MNKINPMLLCDFYKLSHREQYPKGTEIVYSTWIPRDSRIKGVTHVVADGFYAFVKEFLVDFFNENFFSKDIEKIIADYTRFVRGTLGTESPHTEHIRYLHSLGYLPLSIKAVPEGTPVPIRVPMLTIENTDHRCFWLTNYIETLMSCELWQQSTSATIAREYRKILDLYAYQTSDCPDFVQFQGHDFSMRGMGGISAAIKSGAGHLLSFTGTDVCPAITYLEEFYGADIDKELVGTSIPATEHSVQCSYNSDEEYIKSMISDVYPSGMVSIVSDGYDFWRVIGEILPRLKEQILSRSGGKFGDKVVIRPDSGDPVKIVCGDDEGKTDLERKGAIEALFEIFGGTINSKGYKQLNPKIGLIYGDAITIDRCREICDRLKSKGFASTNLVFGIGSYTYQYNTRDTFGFALKSTWCQINGEGKNIFKDPKTDNGVKKSLIGRVCVFKSSSGDLVVEDQIEERREDDILETIFLDGKIIGATTLKEKRERIKGAVRE